MRVGYLGPEGTYTHEALLALTAGDAAEALALGTIHDVVAGVQSGALDEGVVPIENSLEGSVNATLDALAFATDDVEITGEHVLAIHHCLIGAEPLALDRIAAVASHPQALGQCAAFLRERLPAVAVRVASSTAEAVREVVAAPERRTAAIGPRSAAEHYGGEVLVADIEDVAGNETRFARLARRGARRPDGGAAGSGTSGVAGDDGSGAAWKTAVVFWPRESDHPGWLVDCLSELARREVNLTRIESRPRKVGLGEYVFFVDCAGAVDDPAVAAGLDGVRDHVAQLRVLGSFPAAQSRR